MNLLRAILLAPFRLLHRILYGKPLAAHLSEGKEVRLSGVLFKIRKLNVLDHLHGAKVLTENYHVWALGNGAEAKAAESKVKAHYRAVFCQCVIEPKMVYKEQDAGPGEMWVDNMFLDFELAQNLYNEIMFYTYGKKKILRRLKDSLAREKPSLN